MKSSPVRVEPRYTRSASFRKSRATLLMSSTRRSVAQPRGRPRGSGDGTLLHLLWKVSLLAAADALELSLVAESDGEVVGNVAFSAADIGGSSTDWFLLGPVAVQPARQGEGIGRALVETGLDALRSRGACGCVLVSDPAFHGRFGFRQYPGVTCNGVPEENVLCLLMSGEMPVGEVVHHPAFLVGT